MVIGSNISPLFKLSNAPLNLEIWVLSKWFQYLLTKEHILDKSQLPQTHQFQLQKFIVIRWESDYEREHQTKLTIANGYSTLPQSFPKRFAVAAAVYFIPNARLVLHSQVLATCYHWD